MSNGAVKRVVRIEQELGGSFYSRRWVYGGPGARGAREELKAPPLAGWVVRKCGPGAVEYARRHGLHGRRPARARGGGVRRAAWVLDGMLARAWARKCDVGVPGRFVVCRSCARSDALMSRHATSMGLVIAGWASSKTVRP